MQKWEYLILSLGIQFVDEFMSTKKLNELGSQGWEIIAVAIDASGKSAKIILKRPKP